MKVLDVAQASDKIVLAQNEPGTGFEAKIKKDAKEINIDIINISALKNENYTTNFPKFPQSPDRSKLDEIVANSSIKPMPLLKPNKDNIKDGVYIQPSPKFPQSPDRSKFDEIVANSSIKPMPLLKPNKDNIKDGVYTQPSPKFPQSPDRSKFDEIVANSGITPVHLFKPNVDLQFPEVKAPTAWIVNDFDKLTKERQVDVFNHLNDRLKENKDLKIIVPFHNIENISGEVLKNSTLLVNASLLPPIGSPISFSGLPQVDLTQIRRKYNSGDTENKNTPK